MEAGAEDDACVGEELEVEGELTFAIHHCHLMWGAGWGG